MQIHELDDFNGELNSSSYFAIDNGEDTGKVSVSEVLGPVNVEIAEVETTLNARIDNIIAGGTAPSTSEIVDARLGANGKAYSSLGDAIRGVDDELFDITFDIRHGGLTLASANVVQGSYNSSSPYNIVTSTTKLRNKQPIVLAAGDKLVLKPGSNCAYYDVGFFTKEGAWISETNWLNIERTFQFDNDRLVVIAYKNSNNDTITPGEYDATTVLITKQQIELDTHETKIAKIDGSMLTAKDYTTSLSRRCYQNDGGVGSTINMTGYVENQFRCFYMPCVRGDVFKISGTGVNFYRLWCFTDENYVIKSVAAANAVANDLELIAEQDGYFFYQISTAYAGYYVKHMNSLVVSADIDYLTMFTGFGMFQSIAGIGDSYTEGSMVNSGGTWVTKAGINYIDIIAKRNGIVAHNYGSGGKTAQTYLNSQAFAEALADNPSDFYFYALGQNDVNTASVIGTIADIIDSDYTQNPNTFFGNYGKIIAQMLEHAPNAKFVLIGSWIKGISASSGLDYQSFNPAIKEIADHYSVPYIDPFDDSFFSSDLYTNYKNNGHPTAMGYAGMALAMERLFNKCVIENPSYFKLALIG